MERHASLNDKTPTNMHQPVISLIANTFKCIKSSEDFVHQEILESNQGTHAESSESFMFVDF